MASADEVRAGLTGDQLAALEAITSAAEAWSSTTALALAGVGDVAIESLVALELVEWWGPPVVGEGVREELLTLTPWGAAVAGYELDERTLIEDGEAIEVPHWVRPGEGSAYVVLPRYNRERLVYRLPVPEGVPDPTSGAGGDGPADVRSSVYMIDEWTGEPVALWGIPIERDRRGGRRRGRTASA